ncbi:glycosyltransferase family 2 protein [Halomicroarcula sp. GCM10025709]|uniref:glycosyltransferase family 2 protein n=1 Tax=Halomicroarcula sp. GCM10025709 TaxID=3252669 RepID=UPI00362423A8
MTGADRPRVSVVVPTYNRADTVGRAVESALAQTVTDIEVVVVDDGSTDDTAAVVTGIDDERVRYLAHERNRGRSAARNTGIEAARGEYVAFLDSDDRWLPGKLDRQLAELSRRPPEWIGVYCEFLTPSRRLSDGWSTGSPGKCSPHPGRSKAGANWPGRSSPSTSSWDRGRRS